MLTLNRRECALSAKHSGDVKEVDGQQIRTLTFGMEDVLLDKREFNALLGESLAWDAMYNVGVKPVEPLLKSVKELELKDKIEGAAVTVVYGLDLVEAKFVGCELSKIKLALRSGGKVALSCKVTTTPALDESLSELIEQFGNMAECELRVELPSEQQSLPLNRFGEGEQAGAH